MAKEIYDAEIGYGWKSYLPAIAAVVGAFIMLGLRLTVGERFISDGALMMLAAIYAHLFSLGQIRDVFARQVEQGKGPAGAGARPRETAEA